MNALVFTDTDAQILIAAQTGQHRLSPVQLTDGRWFLMEDVLTEILFQDKLQVPYSVQSFESIRPYIPVSEEDL